MQRNKYKNAFSEKVYDFERRQSEMQYDWLLHNSPLHLFVLIFLLYVWHGKMPLYSLVTYSTTVHSPI